jgi:hypothetical protein
MVFNFEIEYHVILKVFNFKIECYLKGGEIMATNGKPGKGRHGAVKDRSQFKGQNGNWIKRDSETGRFMDQKTSGPKPFKGVRKEK